MKPLVSVYCLTYNHEKYIRDALEGFVSQKTSFPFEVYVHDDASTDNTATIIKEYAKKYPGIIKPIYQIENQYSKKVSIAKTFLYPLMKGKYIAICEGDDYWCNENKLQRQVDWLENHPDYSFCVHNTRLIDMRDGSEKTFNECIYDKDISFEEIIQGGGAHFHTSSFMFRAEFRDVPDEFRLSGVGDYPRAIYMSLCGKVRYLHEIMSIYRFQVEGSYTRRYNSASLKTQKEKHIQVIKMLRNVDLYTGGKYKECIESTIQKKEFAFLQGTGNLKSIKKDYYDMYKKLGIKEKAKLTLKYLYSLLLQLYKR